MAGVTTHARTAGAPGLFDQLAGEAPKTIAERVAVASPDATGPRPADGAGAPRDARARATTGAAAAEITPDAVTPARTAPAGSRAAPRQRATAESMASKQREISVSEFFAKNRHLLGFDNKRKALLTTVKEAVDNALDACEEAGLLPEIHVYIDQLAEDRFRVTVRDNGPGIVRAQVPNIFGKLLYGSKFHRLKMSRGQQGIGISAAGMYGLLTTGKPIHITSRTSPGKPAHHFQIAIDTTKNRPDIVRDEEQEVAWERGTQVAIELAATYAKGRQSVDEYLEQTAIANPHARFVYRAPTAELRDFPRGSEELPAETREIQPHPHGIELGVLMKMLKEAAGAPRARAGDERSAAPARTLSGFLQERFCRVTTRVAHEICTAAKLKTTARSADLSSQEAERLYQAMQAVKIMAPPTDCLAPIGVRAILSGLLKEVKAEFYTATTRDPAVYRGNPFLIEVGMAFGGSLSQAAGDGGEESSATPARVIRFANRVPLLYQQSACASFKSVIDVDWRNYGVSQPGGNLPVGPLVIMIHMASVWVPFTSESKEAIADYDEIRKEMKLALQECGRKLATYIRKRKRQRLEADRRSIFQRYIRDLVEALTNITSGSETAQQRLLKELSEIARERTAEADVELDEDGKPIVKDAGPNGEATAADDLAGDESTVVIPENAPSEPPGELFEDPMGTNSKRKRRGRSASN